MPKQIIKWSQVEPGDIVSFRYRSNISKRTLMQTVLILNPKIKMKLKDGTTSEKVIGLKLEQSNRKTLRVEQILKLFKLIGDLEIVDKKSKIYRLKIDEIYQAPWPTGVKKNFYNKIKKLMPKEDIYRVYTWSNVPKTVYLEPIVIK